MTGSVFKGGVGEGFVDPVGKTGSLTAVSFCFVSTVEGGVSTTLVETLGNVTGTTIGDVSCFSDAVETSIAIVTGSFDVVIGILVSSDVIAEESETGNSVSYAVVGTNVDGISNCSDIVEIFKDGGSVSYKVSGSGVDTSSGLCNVIEEASEGGKPVSYAVVGTDFDGVSGLPDLVETSVGGSSVSYIVAGSSVDTSSSL